MKFYLSTVLALLVATTSVSAACQRRRSTIPTTDVTADGTPADEMISTPEEKLVRRHKSGRRLRRDGPRAGSQGNAPNLPQNQSDRSAPSNFHSGGSSGNNNSRSTPSSSMTSAAGSQQSSSKFQGVRSSSSSKAAAQTSKTSTSSSSSSTSTGSSSSSSGSTYNGQATFYYQNQVNGACGSVSSDSDKVVALQTSMYNSGSHCGETITITNTDTGASTTAVVADECPSCSGSQSIDLSTGAFDAIGSEDTGVLNVSWAFD